MNRIHKSLIEIAWSSMEYHAVSAQSRKLQHKKYGMTSRAWNWGIGWKALEWSDLIHLLEDGKWK